MKKLCLAICFCLICNLCNLAVASAERDILADLKWGMTYDEIKAVYPLVYNNYLSEEDSNTYWLKLEEPYLNSKEVVNGRILLYMKGNKLYRITADFTDGTDLVIQSEAAGKLKYIGENLYWGASYAQVNRFYKLKYKEHDSTKNSPVYYLTLPKQDFNGEKLKSQQILVYFWNDQLYKIVAEKQNGGMLVLQDDFLLKKAAAQGALNEERNTHNEAVAKMNATIAAETVTDKKQSVGLIPNLYWGESINDIVKDFAVKYTERYYGENALIYELDLANPYEKKDKAYNNFIKTFQHNTAKIYLYLWHNQLYKIKLIYSGETEQILTNEKLAERAALDGEAYKLGGGNLLKRTYREVYADAMNDKLYMYWGQPFKELSEIYELRWGILWHTIYIYSIGLTEVYQEGSPYLVVMFSNEQLYKILLCFDESIENREKGQQYFDEMKNVLTEKFGRPDIYRQGVLMWQSVEISVNKSEEDYLMSYLNERLYRTAHFFADEAEWAKEK
ncbi:hypothetical protein [Megamonas sp.]